MTAGDDGYDWLEMSISRFAGVVGTALVSRELELEVFRGSAHAFQYFEWNFEFSVARSANRDRRGCSQPFEDSKVAFRHEAISLSSDH
jgi:hypothetical protein